MAYQSYRVNRFCKKSFAYSRLKHVTDTFFFFSYVCHEPELVSHETASSSAECSRDKPPFSFVEGQDSTMWDIVWVSPRGHRSVSVSRHFLLQAPQCPLSVQKRFSRDHWYRGRSNHDCRIVGSHTIWELTTWADFQLCIHQLMMSTGYKSSYSGFLDVSRSNAGLRISGWIGQLSCLTFFSISLSVAAFLCRAGDSMLESTGSHGRGAEWRVPEMRRMVEFNYTSTWLVWAERDQTGGQYSAADTLIDRDRQKSDVNFRVFTTLYLLKMSYITVVFTELVEVGQPGAVQLIEIITTHLVGHLLCLVQLVQTLTICLILHSMQQFLGPIIHITAQNTPITYTGFVNTSTGSAKNAIIIIISKTMFMVLSSWQSHCGSSSGSFDECRTAPSGRQPKTKPDN